MRGITEEKLRELLSDSKRITNKSDELESINKFIEYLLNNECTELNPWQPIDENTPKDRPLLLKTDKGPYRGRKWVGEYQFEWTYPPTHFCELPEDPKE